MQLYESNNDLIENMLLIKSFYFATTLQLVKWLAYVVLRLQNSIVQLSKKPVQSFTSSETNCINIK